MNLRTKLVARLRATLKNYFPLDDSIKEYDQQLAEFFAVHPDAEIFGSFPGAGKALGPRLVSAFGSDRNRYDEQRYLNSMRQRLKKGSEG